MVFQGDSLFPWMTAWENAAYGLTLRKRPKAEIADVVGHYLNRTGLSKFADLGQWWETDTGLPLPLGAILVRRDLALELQQNLDKAVRSSLEYAHHHREEPKAYIREHALEMEDPVMQAHIDLYVNEFSLDVGDLGEKAVRTLYERARALGVVGASSQPLFVPH